MCSYVVILCIHYEVFFEAYDGFMRSKPKHVAATLNTANN